MMTTTTTQFVVRMGVDATLAASIALAAMHSYKRDRTMMMMMISMKTMMMMK